MAKDAGRGSMISSATRTWNKMISSGSAEKRKPRSHLSSYDYHQLMDGIFSIYKKLLDLGYAEELNYLDTLACGTQNDWPPLTIWLFKDHPDVKVPKPLTDRSEWISLGLGFHPLTTNSMV
jgi:hypothetical protein